MRLAGVATLALAANLFAPPAQAAVIGGSIKHYSPDEGYDLPILVSCENESKTGSDTFSIPEGSHSDDICPHEDVNKVYVRYDEQIACREIDSAGLIFWPVQYDKNGWHDVGNFTNKLCVVQRD